jgi:hypothetical protein
MSAQNGVVAPADIRMSLVNTRKFRYCSVLNDFDITKTNIWAYSWIAYFPSTWGMCHEVHDLIFCFRSKRWDSAKLLFDIYITDRRSLYSAVGIATGYGIDNQRSQSSSPGRGKNFLFSTTSKLVLESTQPPIQCVPGALSTRVKELGHKLATQLQLVTSSRNRGSIYPFPIRLHCVMLN